MTKEAETKKLYCSSGILDTCPLVRQVEQFSHQSEVVSVPTFLDLLNQCAFQAFERQTRLSTLIGDRAWLLDTELATITFGDDFTFPVQFLGTESEITNTWLWADANSKVPFPSTSLELCRKVRAIGCKFGLEEFDNDHFPFVDEVGKPTGHTLAMVASTLGGASCYYRGPHENGAVFVAISDARIDERPDLDRESFIEAFNNLLWQPGDMKKRIVSYLSAKGYISKDFDGTDLNCSLYTGEEINLTFRPTKSGGMEISISAQRRKR